MKSVVTALIDAGLILAGFEAARLAGALFYPGLNFGAGETSLVYSSGVIAGVTGSYLTGISEPKVLLERRQLVTRCAFVGAFAALATLLSSYFVWYAPIGRTLVFLLAICTAFAVGSWRSVYALFVERGPRIPCVVLGSSGTARRFAYLLNSTKHTRHVAVGYIGASGDFEDDSDLPVLGTRHDAVRVCHELGISNVVVAINGDPVEDWVEVLSELQANGIRVTTAATMAMSVTRTIPVDIVSARYLLEAFDRGGRPGRAEAKRLLDFLVASLGLVFLILLLPALYVLVKLDSPGPIFFAQNRVGAFGKIFRLYKIRTMQHDPGAPERWAEVADPRVTRVGRLLRKTRIDEFPQFWNVLRGEMSIVGPRPEQPRIVEMLSKRIPCFRYRELVKPGITGWAQINDGYASTVEHTVQKLSFDLYYVRNHDLLLDLDIMLRTGFVMLSFGGAR